MKKNVDLTEGTIWKQLLLFCLPIMFGTLFQRYITPSMLWSSDSLSVRMRLQVWADRREW